MVNETWTFGGAAAITAVGLAVMLYGVSLTSGLSFSMMMGIGGGIVVVGIGLITWGVAQLESAQPAEH